jgi:hypothetical protein
MILHLDNKFQFQPIHNNTHFFQQQSQFHANCVNTCEQRFPFVIKNAINSNKSGELKLSRGELRVYQYFQLLYFNYKTNFPLSQNLVDSQPIPHHLT